MKTNLEIIEYSSGMELPEDYISLYCESFPSTERRNWKTNEDAQLWIAAHKDCRIYLIYYKSIFAGFLNCWNLHTSSGEILYIEHFAVSPSQRGNGLGAAALQTIMADSKTSIILEVEPPTDELTRRRIAFYERNGLKLHSALPYLQPPYFPGNQPIILKIMSSPELGQSEIESEIIPVLHRKVYNHHG